MSNSNSNSLIDQCFLSPSNLISDATSLLEQKHLEIVLVVDKEKKLLGTVTDGDIRNAMRLHLRMNTKLEYIMRKTPITITDETPNTFALKQMQKYRIRAIPVLNDKKQVINLKRIQDITVYTKKENIVIIMAGGLGSRLGELTKDCPKAMLKVGNKPMLEHIIERFKEQGFYRFIISVNYLSDQIKTYFGHGENHDIQIDYIEEKKRMGTAGAISLLNQFPNEPVIVTNGDIITDISYDYLLDSHKLYNAVATMAIREYDVQIPFGVVSLKEENIISLDEKPVHKIFVNAGIYVLEKTALEFIPKDQFFDMTDLFDTLIKSHHKVSSFPIHEYWTDIGLIDQYERAYRQFDRHESK